MSTLLKLIRRILRRDTARYYAKLLQQSQDYLTRNPDAKPF